MAYYLSSKGFYWELFLNKLWNRVRIIRIVIIPQTLKEEQAAGSQQVIRELSVDEKEELVENIEML